MLDKRPIGGQAQARQEQMIMPFLEEGGNVSSVEEQLDEF
jgi:hypothetical protein